MRACGTFALFAKPFPLPPIDECRKHRREGRKTRREKNLPVSRSRVFLRALSLSLGLASALPNRTFTRALLPGSNDWLTDFLSYPFISIARCCFQTRVSSIEFPSTRARTVIQLDLIVDCLHKIDLNKNSLYSSDSIEILSAPRLTPERPPREERLALLVIHTRARFERQYKCRPNHVCACNLLV